MGKRYTSLLILILLVVHLGGYYAYFMVRMSEVRMEMRKKLADLPREELEVIILPQQSFKASWLEEREMKWNGRMYDIAWTENAGASLRVYCLHDEDEDGLLNFISAIVETSRQDTREAPHAMVQFFALKYLTSRILLPVPAPAQIIEYNTKYHVSLIPFTADPVSPPPRS